MDWNVKNNAEKYARESGRPAMIVKINGIYAWNDVAEMPDILARFGNDIVEAVILPMKWVEANAAKPN